jgi:hypothetical protein
VFLKKLKSSVAIHRLDFSNRPIREASFMLLKQLSGALLGLLMLATLVFIWAGVTRVIALVVERALCWQVSYAGVCHLRGAWVFLIWCVVALGNLLIIGLLIEKINRPIDKNGRGKI